MNIQIPCPNCNSQIFINSKLLVMGQSFSCGKCEAEVKISSESQAVTKKAIDEFETMSKK